MRAVGFTKPGLSTHASIGSRFSCISRRKQPQKASMAHLLAMYALSSAESQLSALAVKQSKESRRSEDGPESVRRRFAALEVSRHGLQRFGGNARVAREPDVHALGLEAVAHRLGVVTSIRARRRRQHPLALDEEVE